MGPDPVKRDLRSSKVERAVAFGCLLGAYLLVAASLASEGWESLPLEGAEVRSLVFDPREPQRVYAGTTAGHVYRSEDGGLSWFSPGPQVALPGWVVADLTVDPDDPDRLWAALFGIRGGGLVVVSDDRARSWRVRSSGLEAAGQVYAVARPPGRPLHVFAGTRAGVYRSRDGGESWQRVSDGVAGLEMVGSLYVHPSHPDRVLAGTWRRAYRSEDGGETWQGVFEGMVLDTEVYALRPVIGGPPEEVWAATCGWVYQSLDFASRWKRWQRGLLERRVRGLALPRPGVVIAGTVSGIYRSQDGGLSFGPVGPSRLPVLTLASHPALPHRVLAGTEGQGVWASEDGGETWSPSFRGMRNVRVGALAAVGGEVFAVVDHSGEASGVYRWSRKLGRFLLEPSLPKAEALAARDGTLYALSAGRLYRREARGWRPLEAPKGAQAVQELLSQGNQLYALTASSLYEVQGLRLAGWPLRFRPQLVALNRQALWFSDGQRVWKLVQGGAHLALEKPGGELMRLFGLGDGLVLLGRKGVWWWKKGEPRVLAVEANRVVPVAQSERWFLLLDPDRLWLFDGEREAVWRVPALPFPLSDVATALDHGGFLYVGTRGYGLWRLPEQELLGSISTYVVADSSSRR